MDIKFGYRFSGFSNFYGGHFFEFHCTFPRLSQGSLGFHTFLEEKSWINIFFFLIIYPGWNKQRKTVPSLREKNLLIKFLEIDFRVVRENLEAERTFFSQLKKKCKPSFSRSSFLSLQHNPSPLQKRQWETEQTTEQYNFSPRFSCPPSIPVNSVPIHHVVSLA